MNNEERKLYEQYDKELKKIRKNLKEIDKKVEEIRNGKRKKYN
jgi:hypothetical protein